MMDLHDMLLQKRPGVKLTEHADLAGYSWFRLAGKARLLAVLDDDQALSQFLAGLPDETPLHVLGVGSNVIIRDGGISGVVLKLGRGFRFLERREGDRIRVGAGCLDAQVARFAETEALSGFEFLSTIPGTIGGAAVMNAGAHGGAFHDRLVHLEAIDRHGRFITLKPEQIGATYRQTNIDQGLIVTGALLQGSPASQADITKTMTLFQEERRQSQPSREKTGGSTFKNPKDAKAWKLIDEAGCRGLFHDGVRVSQKHCNFLINESAQRANAIEELGEMVREKVYAHSGVSLEWEIRRLGSSA
jgi:UDP-N-acetylmuramate dehydrogenase